MPADSGHSPIHQNHDISKNKIKNPEIFQQKDPACGISHHGLLKQLPKIIAMWAAKISINKVEREKIKQSAGIELIYFLSS